MFLDSLFYVLGSLRWQLLILLVAAISAAYSLAAIWAAQSREHCIFRGLIGEAETLYLNTNEHARATIEVETRDARFVRDCQAHYPLHQYRRLAPLMHQLRSVKSEEEIKLIRDASALTGKGFSRVLGFLKPGVNEADVEADLDNMPV